MLPGIPSMNGEVSSSSSLAYEAGVATGARPEKPLKQAGEDEADAAASTGAAEDQRHRRQLNSSPACLPVVRARLAVLRWEKEAVTGFQ
jgi:hypothetical protein